MRAWARYVAPDAEYCWAIGPAGRDVKVSHDCRSVEFAGNFSVAPADQVVEASKGWVMINEEKGAGP